MTVYCTIGPCGSESLLAVKNWRSSREVTNIKIWNFAEMPFYWEMHIWHSPHKSRLNYTFNNSGVPETNLLKSLQQQSPVIWTYICLPLTTFLLGVIFLTPHALAFPLLLIVNKLFWEFPSKWYTLTLPLQ